MAPSLRVLALAALSSCLGALLYLHWRQGGQLEAVRTAHSQLQRELTASRGERDQVQFKLNLAREDLEGVQKSREESERRVVDLDEQLQEERGNLREARQELGVSQAQLEREEDGAKRCSDQKATLEEVVDQLKSQLSGCETENRETVSERDKLGKAREVMKEEVNRKRRELDHLTQQLSHTQTEVDTCTRALRTCKSQLQMEEATTRQPETNHYHSNT